MLNLTQQNIVITGSSGFLGSSLIPKLISHGVPKEKISLPQFPDYDFRNLDDCLRALENQDIVIHLAARVGTSLDQQKYSGDFFFDNLMLGAQMVEAARRVGVKKILIVGSINSYPASLKAPFKEDHLWDGYPEAVNASYGIAKRAIGIQTEAYFKQYNLPSAYVIFPNLYGPGYNIDKPNSFFSMALEKISDAKEKREKNVEFRGTGQPQREFLYVDDAASSIILALEHSTSVKPLNIGPGAIVSLKELVRLIAGELNFKGDLSWDGKEVGDISSRSLDSSRAKSEIGFEPAVAIQEGIKAAVAWYQSAKANTK